MTTMDAISAARARFPRGLAQPDGSLRFGLDALLLGALAARHCENRAAADFSASAVRPPLRVAELGCGCGAALLALALRCPQVVGTGLDREEALLHAARQNAATLGLDKRLRFELADLKHPTLEAPVPAGGAAQDAPLDLVLANPPYNVPGRASPSALRERALRGAPPVARGSDPDALGVFCRAAARLLRHHGHFFCIFDASALPRLCAALDAARLGLRRLLPVRARNGEAALRLLVEARKNAAHHVRLEAPLTLHAGKTGTWTAQALRFCPWLGTGPQKKTGPDATPQT